MMRPAGKRCIEPVRLLLAGAFDDMDLHQAVTHEQRARDSGLDGFLVFPAHNETVHNGVHVLDTGFVPSIEVNFFRNIDRCAVNDQPPATLLAEFRKHEIEFFAIDLECRRTQFDLRAFGERKNSLEDLAG